MADCPWDLNGDGVVDDDDVQWLMDHWGSCTPGAAGDFNGDGQIDIADLTTLQSHYGACPGADEPEPPTDLIICTPNERRCRNSTTVEVCNSAGTGWDPIYCNRGYICEGGHCVEETTPPPDMETRTTSLTEGSHTIQVSLSGYDTLTATIDVSASGVTCVNVTNGLCGGASPPSVSTSGSTVTVYLASGSATTGYDDWVNGKGGATGLRSNLAAVGEIIDGYLSSAGDIGYLGFNVSLANIGTTIDYYLG